MIKKISKNQTFRIFLGIKFEINHSKRFKNIQKDSKLCWNRILERYNPIINYVMLPEKDFQFSK